MKLRFVAAGIVTAALISGPAEAIQMQGAVLQGLDKITARISTIISCHAPASRVAVEYARPQASFTSDCTIGAWTDGISRPASRSHPASVRTAAGSW